MGVQRQQRNTRRRAQSGRFLRQFGARLGRRRDVEERTDRLFRRCTVALRRDGRRAVLRYHRRRWRSMLAERRQPDLLLGRRPKKDGQTRECHRPQQAAPAANGSAHTGGADPSRRHRMPDPNGRHVAVSARRNITYSQMQHATRQVYGGVGDVGCPRRDSQELRRVDGRRRQRQWAADQAHGVDCLLRWHGLTKPPPMPVPPNRIGGHRA
jgi:hypothetical protein